jgi:hypothetical protein
MKKAYEYQFVNFEDASDDDGKSKIRENGKLGFRIVQILERTDKVFAQGVTKRFQAVMEREIED